MSAGEGVYSIVSDGGSDRVLRYPIGWLLAQHARVPFRAELVDLGRLPRPPRSLAARVLRTVELSECDLVFVHRDAEGKSRSERVAEIRAAVADAPPWVAVVPVRMTEAWMLFDQAAIRRAAGDPSGTVALDLPAVEEVEQVRDPKLLLHSALRKASGLHGRRLAQFDVRSRHHRTSELIDDFAPLRKLAAFQQFESDLRATLIQTGWAKVPSRHPPKAG